MLTLPRSLMPDVVGHAFVELPVPTDDEEVEVGDGAEGLVVALHLHSALEIQAIRESLNC